MKLSDLKADYKERIKVLLKEKDTIWLSCEISATLIKENFKFAPENLQHFLKSRFAYTKHNAKNYYGTPENIKKAKAIWGDK